MRYLNRKVSDILLTKKELKNQLFNCWEQENLLKLLLQNTKDEVSEKLSLMIAIKFEIISGMFYVGKNNDELVRKKLPQKDYEKILFNDFVENIYECADRLNTMDLVFADVIFKKYCAVKNYFTQMIACVDEQYYACEFMEIIAYVLKNDFAAQAALKSFQEILKEKYFCIRDVNYRL